MIRVVTNNQHNAEIVNNATLSASAACYRKIALFYCCNCLILKAMGHMRSNTLSKKRRHQKGALNKKIDYPVKDDLTAVSKFSVIQSVVE